MILVQTGSINGQEREFLVKAKFNLSEDGTERDFTVESERKSLSTFKNPDAPTALRVSNLASTSLKLSWTAGNLNGCEFQKYRVFDGNQMIKESNIKSADLEGLAKGRDYNLSIVTVAKRAELSDNILLQDVE